MLDMSLGELYSIGMTEQPRPYWFCRSATRDFPVVATALAVAGCFAEALLQKYFTPARGFQIAIALMQAIPAGLLLRYFVVRSRKPNQEISRRADRGR